MKNYSETIYINLWLVLFFGALSIVGLVVTILRSLSGNIGGKVIKLLCFLLLLSDFGLITNAILIRRDVKAQ